MSRGPASLAQRFGQTSAAQRKFQISPTFLSVVVAVAACVAAEGGYPTDGAIAAVAKCGVFAPRRAVTAGWLQLIGKTDDRQAVFALTPKAASLLSRLMTEAA